MQHIFYISTGSKNARYTLRHQRFQEGSYFTADSYICNLADDIERAAEKAHNYFNRIKDRFENAVLVDYPDHEIGQRRGKLSLKATRNIEKIEAGLFPFGKYANTEIASTPDSYILYWADQSEKSADPVVMALAGICMGIAMDRNLIQARQDRREERAFQEIISQFVGEIGQRQEFEGVVFSQYYNDRGFYCNKILLKDGNMIAYVGNKLGEYGKGVKFVATIRDHNHYNGKRTTRVRCPKKVQVYELA